MSLVDNCGRPLLNLRVSVTQRCSYRCTYCHREGEVERAGAYSEMTVEEIVRLTRNAVELGIARVKLTGGEPLMRCDICQIVAGIKAIPGLRDLSLTTNGLMLPEMAKELHAAGLGRINISLASLNTETYSRITGGDLDRVLEGVKAAAEAGFNPVKLNMVILNDVNVDEVLDMVAYAEKMGVILQLIELDPVNVSNAYFSQYHRSLEDQEEILRQKAVQIEKRRFMHNRLIYRLPNVTVEVVHPIENTDFCNHCTRLRVTSDGKLKPCLMRNDNLTDILTPMRQGATDEQLKELFIEANKLREPFNKAKVSFEKSKTGGD